MRSMHVTFVVEPIYGHVIPTLGMALSLAHRGHRVSYAVTKEFAPKLATLGFKVIEYAPIDTRTDLLQAIRKSDGSIDFGLINAPEFKRHRQARTENTLEQLEVHYRDDMPKLVIHDDCLDTAARTFADTHRTPRIRHEATRIPLENIPNYEDDRIVLVSVPKFFNGNIEMFDDRFRFIGFAPEGRLEMFASWDREEFYATEDKVILFSVTTGLLPQVDFCNRIIRAFESQPWRVIMSIAGSLDPIGQIRAGAFESLPENFITNHHSSNFEILQGASLFVGQGGQGSVCEAMYRGVPLLVVPASTGHVIVGKHVEDLGVGKCLLYSEASPERIREAASLLLYDEGIGQRVKQCQMSMQSDAAADSGADIIEEYLRLAYH